MNNFDSQLQKQHPDGGRWYEELARLPGPLCLYPGLGQAQQSGYIIHGDINPNIPFQDLYF